MFAPYPEFCQDLVNEKVSKDFKIIDDVAGTIRKLITSVNLPSSAKPESFCIVLNDEYSK